MKSFLQYLLEADHSSGTYAALVPDAASQLKLDELCKRLGIETPDYLHCTVVYSDVPVPVIEEINPDLPITSQTKGFDIFDTKEGKKCLVIRISSEDIYELHKQTRVLGANYHFPEYKPHVSLSMDYQETTIPKLPQMTITFDKFEVRGLEE